MSWAVDKQRAGTCPGRSDEASRRQRWTRDLDSSAVTGWEGDGWLSAVALLTQGPTLLSPCLRKLPLLLCLSFPSPPRLGLISFLYLPDQVAPQPV